MWKLPQLPTSFCSSASRISPLPQALAQSTSGAAPEGHHPRRNWTSWRSHIGIDPASPVFCGAMPGHILYGSWEGSQWIEPQASTGTHQSTHTLWLFLLLSVSPLSLSQLGVTSQLNYPHPILPLGLSFRETQIKALDVN